MVRCENEGDGKDWFDGEPLLLPSRRGQKPQGRFNSQLRVGQARVVGEARLELLKRKLISEVFVVGLPAILASVCHSNHFPKEETTSAGGFLKQT